MKEFSSFQTPPHLAPHTWK